MNKPSFYLIICGLLLAGYGCSGTHKGQKCMTSIRAGFSERIPEREQGAPAGSVFMEQTRTLSYAERQLAAVREFIQGNIPSRLRELEPLSFISEEGDILILLVTRDYLAVGTEGDFVRMPLSLPSANTIAKEYNMYLPTPEIVNAIYEQAKVRLEPQPMEPGPEMRSGDYYLRHNRLIEGQMSGSPEGLIAGHKKDVVISLRMSGQPDRVPIYGWHRKAGDPIQPLSLVHGATYEDYSHGLRLVSPVACLNGEPVPLGNLFDDPVWGSFLSNEPGLDPQELSWQE